jgi:hypothetical protein
VSAYGRTASPRGAAADERLAPSCDHGWSGLASQPVENVAPPSLELSARGIAGGPFPERNRLLATRFVRGRPGIGHCWSKADSGSLGECYEMSG